ncbi:MAG: 2-succinyl-6-hydroxy-2,4-cyclohexadiene-1-carboxylate synthase [Melioribacteraceae bacterium]|jgi:2-succinyl-6-hydroxy-2,4-cyclohexadiene-1-carboxylate synthase|nr:2-succinyl-6-hydroxy-2,4-cyclohexadiene-1-carboxylate synthase [Melioribacteraceae bacterium]
MQIYVDNIAFNLQFNESDLNTDKTPIIFLHGFTGCAEDWFFIHDKLPDGFYAISIDLIGHGKSDSPEELKHYSTAAITCQLNKIILKLGLEKIVIAGYSMGGRAALSYCCKFPHTIKAAILESTTAGIQDFNQKKERVEFDLLLSEKIKLEGVEKFLEYWFSIPLFESLKDIDNFESIKNQRTQNNVMGLSNILAGFSSGLMPNYWNRLNLISFPVLLVSGELDEKYSVINSKMSELIPNVKHEIVSGCGHNVHLENPVLFSKFVNQFLNKTFTSR